MEAVVLKLTLDYSDFPLLVPKKSGSTVVNFKSDYSKLQSLAKKGPVKTL